MSFVPVRERGAINPKGGAIIRIKEVADDGAELGTVLGSVYDLGYIQETTFKDNTPQTTLNDESGDAVAVIDENREVVIEGVLMQSDKNILDIAKEVRGKFYALYKYNGIKNGKHQEIFYGVGKFDPGFEIKYMGGTVPFKYTAMKLSSAVTIAASLANAAPTGGGGAWGGYVSATVIIAKDDYYTIVETTV